MMTIKMNLVRFKKGAKMAYILLGLYKKKLSIYCERFQ